LLVLDHVSKRFGPTLALDDVSVSFEPGVVHALVGENGAGKSTLMNVVAGLVRPDPPSAVMVDGHAVDVDHYSPRTAQAHGIALVPQEFALIESMTVAENIFLGKERRSGPFLRRAAMRTEVTRLLDHLGANFDADTPVERLSIAQAQLVEIAKALASRSRIVAMDEPSAVLAGEELERLFTIVDRLADGGVAVIYVSHRLDEVFEHCRRFTVLKDGRVVGSGLTRDVGRRDLVRLMVGRDISDAFPPRAERVGRPLLRARGLTVPGTIEDVDLEVRTGEIVGIAGLMGSGRTTLAKAIIGAIPVQRGSVEVGEVRGPFRDPRRALAAGLAYLPEDRKREGLATHVSVRANTTLLGLARVSGGVLRLIRRDLERSVVEHAVRRFSIRTSPDGEEAVEHLSGGNQQKVVVAKWLEAEPKILILDEPTRGIDVGSKEEFYRLLRELATAGLGIVVISSELIEVLGLADRILVMSEGRIAGELAGEGATEEDVMSLATGSTVHGDRGEAGE
jgi:ABC-type sugar transport system ATPase subunit